MSSSHNRSRALLAALALLAASATHTAHAAPASAGLVQDDWTDRIVVKMKPGAQAADLGAAARSALGLTGSQPRARVQSAGAGQVRAVISLSARVSVDKARDIAHQVAADPKVAYAEPDYRVHVHSAPNDPGFVTQWALQPITGAQGGPIIPPAGGANFVGAWGMSTGAGVTVAVLDTGILPHADLDANYLGGYDFVTDTTMSGDGDGRDADPTDPGDYCASSSSNSSWHGLMVSSQIGAITNNGIGISGAAYNAKFIMARVLGRCGGYLSDAADAITWAAGGHVSGVPDNAHAAKVINLSMGAQAACPSYMQDAVTAARAAGAVIVASAGNDAGAVSSPANCTGVIAVGAHTYDGDLASYSNFGAKVDLTAAGGGGCKTLASSSCNQMPTLALGNLGTQGATVNSDQVYFAGTSAAAPQVSSAVALLFSAHPDLTPDQVLAALKAGARPFPAGTFCAANPGMCGSGMLDATGALLFVAGGPAISVGIDGPTNPVASGASVALSSHVLGAIDPVSYHWHIASGTAGSFTDTGSSAIRLVAPANKAPNGAPALVVALDVTDSYGRTATTSFPLTVDNPPTLSSLGTVKESANQPFTVDLGASDPDGDPVTVQLLNGTPGVSIVPAGGKWQLSGALPAGTYTVTYEATAAGLTSTQQTVTLTVAESAPASGGGGAMGPFAGVALLLAIFLLRKNSGSASH